jgi:thiosulfate reductase cytochrome b subunit
MRSRPPEPFAAEGASEHRAPPAGATCSQRRSALVRACHWLVAASVIALLVSGGAILLAHPRMYWGETGVLGAPSLFDLPLPFVFGQTGWARALHFLCAWVFVTSGSVYVLGSVSIRHFQRHLLPSRAELAWKSIRHTLADSLRRQPQRQDERRYNPVQKVSYLAVIFLLSPLAVWTGLAMSPAVTSSLPFLAEVLGGRQSARTLHFFAASVLLAFLLVHIAMLCRAGGGRRLSAMIAGTGPAQAAP